MICSEGVFGSRKEGEKMEEGGSNPAVHLLPILQSAVVVVVVVVVALLVVDVVRCVCALGCPRKIPEVT